MTTAPSLEANFFRALNAVAEPAIRAGFGSPGIWPTGYVVVEHTGRKSGEKFRAPVAVSLWGDALLAGTARAGRSQWLKNLAANPNAHYWMLGRERVAEAVVLMPGAPTPDITAFPALLRPLVPTLTCQLKLGWGFAILTPQASVQTSARP